MDAQQAEQKLAHKAAQHTHQDVAAKGSFRAHKTPGQISGQCTHQHAHKKGGQHAHQRQQTGQATHQYTQQGNDK